MGRVGSIVKENSYKTGNETMNTVSDIVVKSIINSTGVIEGYNDGSINSGRLHNEDIRNTMEKEGMLELREHSDEAASYHANTKSRSIYIAILFCIVTIMLLITCNRNIATIRLMMDITKYYGSNITLQAKRLIDSLDRSYDNTIIKIGETIETVMRIETKSGIHVCDKYTMIKYIGCFIYWNYIY